MGRTPTKDDFRQIPRRAIIALLSRCARRVGPLLGRDDTSGRAAFEAAVCAAEQYANGAFGAPAGSASTVAFECSRQTFGSQSAAMSLAACAAQAADQASGASIITGPVVLESPLLPDTTAESMSEAMLDSAGKAIGCYVAALPYSPDTAPDDPSWIDYQTLLTLRPGTFQEAGKPVNSSEAGP